MEKLICPFCKEHYQVKRVIEYKRFICGNCGRKHIYHNGRLVPFSLRRPRTETIRIESCAYCRNDFTLEDDASGEYICPFCNNVLYILPPSGEMPGEDPVGAPHELEAPHPASNVARTAVPNSPDGDASSSSRQVEEARRNTDVRKFTPRQ